MIDLRILQWRKERSRGHAGTLNPESLEYQTAKHHFRKAQKNEFAGCADKWAENAGYRKCMKENKRTYEA